MTHYSENPGNVRVDRFKVSGKWYDTFEVDMEGYYLWRPTAREALESAIKESVSPWLNSIGKRIIDSSDDQKTPVFFLVCLEPYHENAYPVVLWME